jgi:hypothetical protein
VQHHTASVNIGARSVRYSPTLEQCKDWMSLCGVRLWTCTEPGGVEMGGSIDVLIIAEDTGPADACNEACFWHCTLLDGTRKATPSQPSRVAHGAVDQNGAGVPCCKPAGALMWFSGVTCVGSTLPARRCWPFVFKPSARLEVVFFSSPPLHLSLYISSSQPSSTESWI